MAVRSSIIGGGQLAFCAAGHRARGANGESLPILVRTKRSQPGLKTKGRRNTIIEPALNGGLSAKNPQMRVPWLIDGGSEDTEWKMVANDRHVLEALPQDLRASQRLRLRNGRSG